jgi:PadR family transcriptional regulator AphA
MSRTNKSQYAILGILGRGPRSGYDIKKLTDQSTRYFWAENYGNLYPTLKKLEQEGLATSERQPQEGKPDRKVYAITEAGREALAAWLSAPTEPSSHRNELLLKLFFGSQVPLRVSLEQLRRYRAEQEALLETYAEIERWFGTARADHPDAPYELLTLSYGRFEAEALVRWCDESLERLETLEQARKENL